MDMEVPAGQFKAHCLRLMDEVRRNRREIIITKRGVPVARLVPVEEAKAPSLFGAMKGSVIIKGDIVGPLDVEWEAQIDGE
jgi:prevent-host-death family protein